MHLYGTAPATIICTFFRRFLYLESARCLSVILPNTGDGGRRGATPSSADEPVISSQLNEPFLRPAPREFGGGARGEAGGGAARFERKATGSRRGLKPACPVQWGFLHERGRGDNWTNCKLGDAPYSARSRARNYVEVIEVDSAA